MTRTAIVENVDKGVHVKNNDFPSSKTRSSRKFRWMYERSYAVNNPSGLEVNEGDTVELLLPSGRTVISTAIMFLFPLSLFPVGYTLAGKLWTGMGEEGRFLVGLGALFSGLPLGALMRKIAMKIGILTALPEIVRVLTANELLSCGQDSDSCGGCTHCE